MTDRPSDDGKRTRSDAASRLAALLADATDELSPPASPAPDEQPVAPDDGTPGRAGRRRAGRRRGAPSKARSEGAGPDTEARGTLGTAPPTPSSRRSQDGGARRDQGPVGDGTTVPIDMSAVTSPAGPARAPSRSGARPDSPEAAPPPGDGPPADRRSTTDDRSTADDRTRTGERSRTDDRPPADDRTRTGEGRRTGDGPPASERRNAPRRSGRSDGARPEPWPASRSPREGSDGPGSAPSSPPTPSTRSHAARPTPGPGDPPEPRLGKLTLRSVGFAVVFVVLLAAVPALGWVGTERLFDSKGGTVVDGSRSSSEPGYRALVEPTQTALVIQRDPDGQVVAATLLALGMGQTGGTVLQIPLDTVLRVPKYTLDRLEQVADIASVELFVGEVEDRLNLAVGSTIELDDERLADLVAPVAPLTFDLPDAVVLDSGEVVGPGPVSLDAEDLGPFLRATDDDVSDVARLAHNTMVWQAWLEAIESSDTSDSIGLATTGIGPFLRTLAAGDPAVEVLDVEKATDVTITDPTYVTPLVPAPGFEEQIVEAVPFPQSPAPGRRYNLTLLNGVDGEELPSELMRDLILRGAALTYLGNAEAMDQATTTIRYRGESWEEMAELAGEVLGATEVSEMTAAAADAEGEDMVITVGQDTLERYRDGG